MSTIQFLTSASLLVGGVYLGYRVAMHQVAINAPKQKTVTPTTDFTLTTGVDGTVYFTGSITSTDFLEAVNNMGEKERAFIVNRLDERGMSREARAVYVLRGLYHIFRQLVILRNGMGK